MDAEIILLRTRVRESIRGCTACGLSSSCRAPVPFRGPSPSQIVVVGEAPGAEEDKLGQPFVGPSGQLARRMLRGVGIDPDAIAWLNVVSCFPNRTPTEAEVISCRGNLESQLRLLQPSRCLALGGVALSSWWGGRTRIGEARGRWWREPITGAWAMATWHPSAVLRSGGEVGDRGREAMVDLAAFVDTKSPTFNDANYYCVKCGQEACTWVDCSWKEITNEPGGVGLGYCRKHGDFVLGRGGGGRRA